LPVSERTGKVAAGGRNGSATDQYQQEADQGRLPDGGGEPSSVRLPEGERPCFAERGDGRLFTIELFGRWLG
jgi:hypothetical protein